MAGNETTLKAKVQIDSAALDELISEFRRAGDAADKLERKTNKAGNSVKRLGKSGGGGGGGGAGGVFGAGGILNRGTSGIGFAALSAGSQLAAQAISGSTTGGDIGSSIGLTAGLAAAIIPGLGPVISAVLTPILGEIGRKIGEGFDKLQATVTTGFTAAETAAARRLDAERRSGGDLNDAQTRVDQLIVEAAKARVAQEENTKYLREMLKQGQISQDEFAKIAAKLGVGQDIMSEAQREQRNAYVAGLVGGHY